jgi:hypothetical protein
MKNITGLFKKSPIETCVEEYFYARYVSVGQRIKNFEIVITRALEDYFEKAQKEPSLLGK